MSTLWYEAIKKGLSMYHDKDSYCYLYGCKGEKLTTRAKIEKYFDANSSYFSKYTSAEKEQIITNSLGKTGYDCSGFIQALIGDSGNSTTQFSHCTKTTTLSKGVAGSLVYTTYNGTGRHIGIDTGYGWCLQMARESTDAVVKAGTGSIVYSPLSDTAWEQSGESTYVDYTDSRAY